MNTRAIVKVIHPSQKKNQQKRIIEVTPVVHEVVQVVSAQSQLKDTLEAAPVIIEPIKEKSIEATQLNEVN